MLKMGLFCYINLGDGKLSIDEIVDNMNVLNQHCVNGTELLSAFNKIDKDGNGSIRYEY